MEPKLSDIDTSALEKLESLAERRNALEDLVQKLEQKSETVSEVVYQRVKSDYDTRLRKLAQEARQLKATARKSFDALRAYYEEIKGAMDAAKANKEEIELRHQIGEFGEEEFAQRKKEPEQIFESSQAALVDIEELRRRFFEVFDSKGEDEAELDSVAEPPEVESAAGEKPEASLDQTRMVSSEVPGPPPPVATKSPDETRLVEQKTLVKVAAAQSDSAPENATFIVPSANLVSDKDGQTTETFPLGAINQMGRTLDNHIRVTTPGVSRRHAVIEAGPNGFIIRDLESQNGTYVNGERITKHELADGDRVQIGRAKFVFKAS